MSNEPGAPAPVVEVRGLEKAYGPVRALRGVDFSIPAGEVVGFLGPNGAGKTTAMKILTGYLAADGGEARVCGHDVETEPIAVKERLGYLPENNPLYAEQRVADFLGFAARARGLARARRRAALERVVELTGLAQVYRRPIGECSKGFRQRVGLAQALLHDPPLLILDEPTNGLDPLQAVEMRELVRGLGRTKTVILTSHVLPEVEALAQRVVLLHQGRKVADAAVEELGGPESGGQHLRLGLRGTRAQLEDLAAAVGARVLESRPHPFGDPAYVAAELQLERGAEAVEMLAAAAAARDLPLVELAPHGASLEALFRRLAGSEEVEVA